MNEINIICSSFEEIQTQNNGSILSVFNLNHVEFSNNFVFKVSSTTFPGCLYVTNTNLLKVTHNSFQSCFSSGGNAHFGQVLLSLSTNVICSHITASSCSPSSTEYGDSLFRDESSTLDADQINISYSYDEAIGSSSFSLNQNNDHTNMKFLNVAHTFSFTSLEITSTMNDGCKCLCQLSNFINTSNNRNVLSIGYETIIDTCVFIEHFPINVTRYPQYTTLKNCVSDTQTKDISISYRENPTTLNFHINSKNKCKLITYYQKCNKQSLSISFVLVFIIKIV